MEFMCKLLEVDDMLYRLREAVRTYEVHPTEESLGWGRSMVCEFDYTVHIPALKLFFRDAVEYDFDEEEQEEMPIEAILHCYREGETVPDYGCYTTIRSHVLWYIKDQGISIENPDELKCVIDMPYDVDVEGVTEKFEEFLSKIEWKEKATIIPEIFGIQYQEVYITKWIAYLLRQKYFGCMILNALLRINGSAPKIEEGDIRKVRTEYVFYNRRRIDILIFTKHFLVGIEHKIWSGEQKNQTADYQEHMRELSPNQEPIGIYLHPEQNRSKSKDFRDVTYTELYDELSKVNISDVQESFEKRLFEQFMSYIKEYFYMKKGEFPKISKNAELYAKNISLIQDVYSEYKAVSHGVIEWLVKKFEDAGYAVLNNPGDNHLQYM